MKRLVAAMLCLLMSGFQTSMVIAAEKEITLTSDETKVAVADTNSADAQAKEKAAAMKAEAMKAQMLAIQGARPNEKKIEYAKNAKTLSYAFIFDGPSDRNDAILEQFKKAITITSAPDFKASFPKNLVYTGDWTQAKVKQLSDKAMTSNANVVISLGYMSSQYLNNRKDNRKFAITIDQYGLRDLGANFFNPISQSVKGIQSFHRLVNFKKLAVLMNENYYNYKSDWYAATKDQLQGFEYVIIPTSNDIDSALAKIPSDCDAVVLTPMFNLSKDNKQTLINKLNEKHLYTYSTMGKEDVEDGVLLGIGAIDLDRKIAEQTSFNIKGVLMGKGAPQTSQLQFYEDEVVYINMDTAEAIGYQPHLRVLNNAEIISKKPVKVYTLTAIFDTLGKQNLDIQRKALLVKAARRSAVSAALRYLPTLSVTLGYQQYSDKYADSVSLSYPEKTGVFKLGMDQVLYSPALVTNILVKKKQLDFSKHEKFMTEQNMGIDIALLYIDMMKLKNSIDIQKEHVRDARENLAIARVREKRGISGMEEVMRWATQLNISEQQLLDMNAEYKNLKITINKLLNNDEKENFELAPLTAMDPAFYTREINIIDYVSTPKYLEDFTQMLIDESYKVSPELAKLRAAIKMKDYEMSMYIQKFVLPDAKLSLEYTSLLNPTYAKDTRIWQPNPAAGAWPAPIMMGGQMVNMGHPNNTNLRFGIFAQWKPIEGGTKFAEIARVKAERDELQKYQDAVKLELEGRIRSVINKAIAEYFSIEKNYKAMYTAQENYEDVKQNYLIGKSGIAQLVDAEEVYLDSKLAAMNSQYEFLEQLVWVQRSICAVNWVNASDEAKDFIKRVKQQIEKRSDIQLL